MTEPRIRAYRADDASAIAELFYRAVHETAASHYDEEARRAWAPAPRPAEDWHERLGATLVQQNPATARRATITTCTHSRNR